MANYLPVLLVSVSTNAVPDDSSVSTLPRGQVDYLSHDWREEDVWRSWRNMTRQKNEIANGMRLENASWRTWWKQRNKLKTVTPETLNWLKDSDVTWLYGPLHTAVDWTPPPPPPPKPQPTSVDDVTDKTACDTLDLHTSIRGATTGRKKPILKHRSICELLTSDLPSPLFSPVETEDEAGGECRDDDTDADGHGDEWDEQVQSRTVSANAGPPKRPMLLYTKSDTHITRWGANRAFRRDSPPRIIASDVSDAHHAEKPGVPHPHSYPHRKGTSELETDTTTTTSSALSATTNGSGKKKHISFNTFVEQYISIEKPKEANGYSGVYDSSMRSGSWNENGSYDDGYDEDSEGGYTEEEGDVPLFPEDNAGAHIHQTPDTSTTDSEEEDEDEDDVLEMRTPSSPRIRPPLGCTSSSSSSSGHSSRHSSATRSRPRRSHTLPTPSEKTHVTIAPIAPTILKTTGVGNGTECGYGYSWDGIGPRSGPYQDSSIAEESRPVDLVYVPTSGGGYAAGSRRSPRSGSIDTDMDKSGEGSEDVYHHQAAYFSVGSGSDEGESLLPIVLSQPFFAQPVVQSPSIHKADVGEAGGEEDAYDYFAGPDLGEEYNVRRGSRRSESKGEKKRDTGEQAKAPEVVLNGVAEPEERPSRSRSQSRSRSRTPSPVEALVSQTATPLPSEVLSPTPTVAIPHRSSVSSPALLSPPEVSSGRGRSPIESRGRSSSDGRGRQTSSSTESRGRSATRNSSFSDRERSSSRGTSSPLGSISPDGSGVAIGFGAAASASGIYSARPSSRGSRRQRASTSLSPEEGRLVVKPPHSSSSSSSSTISSTPTVKPPPLVFEESAKSEPLPIPSPIMEEDEELQRSRQPTPSNSPVNSMRPVTSSLPSPPSVAVPLSPTQASSPIPIPSHTNAKGFIARSPPSNPTKNSNSKDGVVRLDERGEQNGTLVGRAVEIVSTAGAFLGAIWHS